MHALVPQSRRLGERWIPVQPWRHVRHTAKGVPQNYAEAVRWYRKAADQGYADAQFNLGNMYAKGLGVPQDSAEAVHWYYEAADSGDAGFQFNLGNMYANGTGVPQDSVEAYMWLTLATSRAFGNAQTMYDNMRKDAAKKMNPQQIAEAQRRAQEWKPGRGGHTLQFLPK